MKTYYYLDGNNAVLGPVDLAMLKTMRASEIISIGTMVFVAEEQQWCRLGELLKTESDGDSSWYIYKLGDSEIGPVSKEELQELYRAGNITHKTPVRIGHKKEWVTYNDLLPWWKQSLTVAYEGPTAEEVEKRKPSSEDDRSGNKTWTPYTNASEAPKRLPEGLELATLWRVIGALTCLSWIIIALVWRDDMPVYVVLSVILGAIIGLMLCLTLATVVHACALYIHKHQQPTP